MCTEKQTYFPWNLQNCRRYTIKRKKEFKIITNENGPQLICYVYGLIKVRYYRFILVADDKYFQSYGFILNHKMFLIPTLNYLMAKLKS